MPNPIPVGYNDVLSTLIAWGQSGLKPGATVVKSYLPPVKDPQTGVEVLIPATTFKNVDASESRELTKKLMALPKDDPDVPSFNLLSLSNSWGEELPTIYSLPSAPYAGSGVFDFNVNNDDPNGPQTFVGLRTGGLGGLAEYMASRIPLNPPEEKAPVPTGTGISGLVQYAQAQKKYVDSLTNNQNKNAILSGTILSGKGITGLVQLMARRTAADRVAKDALRGLPRITDRFEDAKSMLETPLITDPVEGSEPSGLASLVRSGAKPVIDPELLPEGGKAFIPRRYELKATGIPCAIPGVLNCILTKYDSVDTTDKQYTYINPKVGMYYVSDNDVRQANGTYADDGNTIRIVPIDPDVVDKPPLSIITGDTTGTIGGFLGDIVYGK